MRVSEYLALPLEDQRNLLKEKLSETVPRGEIKEAAHAAGLNDYTLYKARDPECETHNLIRPELIALIHHTGRYLILDFLEGLFDRVAFAVPKPTAEHADINRATTKSLRSFSAYMEEVTGLVEALDDGENMLDHQWNQELKDVELACRKAQGQLEALLYTVRLARGTVRLVKIGTPEGR